MPVWASTRLAGAEIPSVDSKHPLRTADPLQIVAAAAAVAMAGAQQPELE